MTVEPTDSRAELVRDIAAARSSRVELWVTFLRRIQACRVAELGVYRGEFAAQLLEGCPSIERYYMIDPWRHLGDWNKPANRNDESFERIFAEAMRRTQPHEQRRVVLRGRTAAVIDRIPNASLDFAYVDGDHTLRGITIDLMRAHDKVRPGGWIAGDDFSPSIWQHGPRFEPTLVFPYAVHFAEAIGARIYGLPYRQFLIDTQSGAGFAFIDLTAKYHALDLLGQLTSDTPAATEVLTTTRRKRGRVRTVLKRALPLRAGS
jgi:predicted O-methyltransferase YrrM